MADAEKMRQELEQELSRLSEIATELAGELADELHAERDGKAGQPDNFIRRLRDEVEDAERALREAEQMLRAFNARFEDECRLLGQPSGYLTMRRRERLRLACTILRSHGRPAPEEPEP